jgi:hypothetical protein
MDAEPSIVGEPINRFGFVYAPVNKEGVATLFAKVAARLQMQIEEVRPSAPHCIARRHTTRGWERVGLLFAYKSSDLRDGTSELPSAHLIVCWKHDWKHDWPDCPQQVIELRTVTRELMMIHGPPSTSRVAFSRQISMQATLRASHLPGLEEYLKRQSDPTRRLLNAIDAGIRALSDRITARVMRGRRCVGGVSYYTPERLFFCADFLHTGDGLTLSVFTGGRPWEGLNPSRLKPWGFCIVRTQAELPRVLALAKAAYETRKRAQ